MSKTQRNHDEEAYFEVYQKAISLLSRRNHSEKELREKLIARGFPKDLIDAVIEELSEKKYLNDLENARIYVEFRKDSKSLFYLKNKLYEKGVDRTIIARVLSEQEVDEFEIALNLVRKKYHLSEDEDGKLPYDQVAKICRSLGSKGFSYRTISRIKDFLL